MVVAFARVVLPVTFTVLRYVLPETVSAVDEAYVVVRLVAQPVVMLASVEEAFAKVWSPVQELALARLSESEVELPRETVPPPERPEPEETVTLEFWSWLLPMVEVATTWPAPLTAMSELARPPSVAVPMDAFVAYRFVDDAVVE